MSSRTYPYEVRRAAVDDYTSSGDTLTAVANRHGVSRNALNDWVRSEEGIGLTGGEWVNVRGVMRWVEYEVHVAPPLTELIACACGARLSEPCRTSGGNATTHLGRLIPRRCPCGNPLPSGRHYCTQECRNEARAETYRKREKRVPTRERRAA